MKNKTVCLISGIAGFFGSHMLEHLSYEDGINFIKEC
jgi:predicted SAM-dependent methyltransferase